MTLPCRQSRGSAIPGSDAFLVFRVENPDKDAYGWIYVHFGFPFINEMPCINSSVHPYISRRIFHLDGNGYNGYNFFLKGMFGWLG